MKQQLVTVEMLKKFGEVIENKGTIQGSFKSQNAEICRLPLEKGYVYEVYTVIYQGKSSYESNINSYIFGNNCTVYNADLTRGTGLSGGGVTNSAIVRVDKDNAYVQCSTYVYDTNIKYYGYIRARKIGIV